MPLGASSRKPLPQSPCRKIEPGSSASRPIGETIRTLNKDWMTRRILLLCAASLCVSSVAARRQAVDAARAIRAEASELAAGRHENWSG
jgi:hypothetical protein